MPEPNTNVLDVATFLRLFEIRAPQIMWFLGAGASCAAGIPSAGDMIWDFKRKLFCSEQRVPASAVTDIGEAAVRRRIQAHLDGRLKFPPAGSEEEYSRYFKAAFPAARDRRAYIHSMVTAARPSFGHHTMALLMRGGLLRVVWTTNFDTLVEDAAAIALGGVGHLLVADLAEPQKAARGLDEARWPLLVKLHGDFQSERLMNTSEELCKQDAEMRRNLVAACGRFGLAVVGYSGRDASVMDALEAAVGDGRGFPGGLFWFVRRGDAPFARVARLVNRARAVGVEAWLVEVESFDELLGDIARYLPSTAHLLESHPGLERRRRSAAPLHPRNARTPVVRMAALPILSAPTACRLAESRIGGTRDLREAIAAAGVDIDAQRCSAGVIAFGRDADLRKALAPFGPVVLDTYALSPDRLRSDTQQMALVHAALCRALAARPGLHMVRRRGDRLLLADPAMHDVELFNRTQEGSMDSLTGTIRSSGVKWREACALRLDRRLDRLWLLLEPRIVLPRNLDALVGARDVDAARAFVRERQAARRNRNVNSILDGWISVITGGQETLRLRAFNISNGADADFEISRVSPFSGRSR